MKKILILILALFVIQGCALTSAYEEMPTLPTKPQLPSLQRTPDGGIMLDKRDAGELMRYILDLERGYK
ncbi:hypothetical protein Rostov7_00001 [Vibrio phage Rostov 7]|nr:hypothetical protein Rostov7_00001 [Vibrio phage Rostov 7]